MDFLGVGIEELVFILVILFLILGPKDLVKLGSTLGTTLRNVRKSGAWRSITSATQQLRELPENLARQAGIDDLREVGKELSDDLKKGKAELEELDRPFSAWTRMPEKRSQKKINPSETQQKESN